MALNESKTSADRFQQMLDKLKSLDFRITPQRLAVLRILAASEDHPSAEQIFEKVRIEFPDHKLGYHLQDYWMLKGLNEV